MESKVPTQGQNPLPGVILDYYIPQNTDSTTVVIDILKNDRVIRSYTSEKPEKKISWPGAPPIPKPLSTKTGYHRFNWDLRSAMLPAVDRVFVYGSYEGGVVPPGEYTARIQSGETQHTVAINLLADPNIEATAQAYQEQAVLLEGIENHIREIHQTVQGMREVQKQLTHYLAILEEK